MNNLLCLRIKKVGRLYVAMHEMTAVGAPKGDDQSDCVALASDELEENMVTTHEQ